MDNPRKSCHLIGQEQRKYHFLLVVPSVRSIGEWRAVRGLCQTKDGLFATKQQHIGIGSIGAAVKQLDKINKQAYKQINKRGGFSPQNATYELGSVGAAANKNKQKLVIRILISDDRSNKTTV